MINFDCTETTHIVYADVEYMPAILKPTDTYSKVTVSRLAAEFRSDKSNGYDWHLWCVRITGTWTYADDPSLVVDSRFVILHGIEHLAGTWLYSWVQGLMKEDPVLKLNVVVG